MHLPRLGCTNQTRPQSFANKSRLSLSLSPSHSVWTTYTPIRSTTLYHFTLHLLVLASKPYLQDSDALRIANRPPQDRAMQHWFYHIPNLPLNHWIGQFYPEQRWTVLHGSEVFPWALNGIWASWSCWCSPWSGASNSPSPWLQPWHTCWIVQCCTSMVLGPKDAWHTPLSSMACS